jgi:hypothetical protein
MIRNYTFSRYFRVNYSRTILFSIVKFYLTSFSFLSTNFCNEYEIGGQLELSILPAIVYDTSKLFPTFFHLLKCLLEVFRGGRLKWRAARENLCFFSNICYYAWVYSAKNLTSSPPSFAILRKYSLLGFLQLAVMRRVGSLRGGRLWWCAAWEMFQSSQMCGLHPTAAGITTCPSQS